MVDGKRVIMLGSNNYLGLTRHPAVLQAAHEALDRYGPSMTGSRLLNGTSPIHLELEEALADFLDAETAIVFSTGYLANLGAVSALIDRHGVSVLDRDVHASIYDAAGLALGKYTRFQHNDPKHLDRVLTNLGTEQPRLVLIDGAYSMGGDLAPLPELREVCRKHNTRMLVDDAHAIGTVGPRGRGDTVPLRAGGAGRPDHRNVQQNARVGRRILRRAAHGDRVHSPLRATDALHRRAAAGLGRRRARGVALDRRGTLAS